MEFDAGLLRNPWTKTTGLCTRETFCFKKDNEQSFNHSESEVFFYLGLKENKIEQINLKMLAH